MRRPRAGLLTLYIPFYESIIAVGGEKLLLAADLERRLLEICEVVSPGLVGTEDAARDAAELFHARQVDALVVVPMVAVFGALGWAAVRELDVPVCIWNLQPTPGIPDDYDIRQLIRNSGGLGVQALANTIARAERPYEIVFSTNDDPLPIQLGRFLEAAAVTNDLKRARFGRIGSVFAQMTDVLMDIASWPGEPVVEILASDLQERYLRQTREAVSQRVADIRERHPVFEISDDELARSARIWLAVDEIVQECNLVGGAFNCHGENCLRNPEIGVTGCYAVSAQTSQGHPFSCTGDLPTAIAMWMLDSLAGSVIYAELDLVDPGANCVLLANGGEGHFTAAEGPVSITGNENFVGLHGRGASLRFTPVAGKATLASFSPIDASRRYRLVVAEGEMFRRCLPALGVFHTAFRFHGLSAPEAFQSWCKAGAVHHVAVAPGEWAGALQMIADMSGFEFVNVRGTKET